MSSGSGENNDFADSSGGNDQADSDGSREQSNSDSPDDVEGHEPLGRCPFGHDNTNRDCRCPCPECPNQRSGRIRPNNRRDRNLPPLTPLGVTRRIRREITHRIQQSGYFRAEEDRVDHGGVEVPYHTETVGLPSHPPLRGNLRTNDRTAAAPLTNTLGVDGFAGVSARVGGFEGPENSSEFPTNPKDHHRLSLAIGQRPCTEMIPWISRVERWTDPCPRDRRILGNMDLREGNQHGEHWPCNQHNCQVEESGEKIQRYNLNQEPLDESSDGDDEDDGDHDEDFKDDWREYNDEAPPGDPGTHNGKRWVCSDHKEDAEEFWEHENLLQAHRVPTCKECNAEYQRRYPLGHNSCTCPNLLGRWQCRRCFEKKVRTVQTHFRQRVGALYTGDADFGMISSNSGTTDLNRIDLGPGLGTYHWQQWPTGWRQVRRMLIARHPCINPGLSHACGRKRVASYNAVLHCRSCGGVVVPPSVNTHRIGTRSRRQVEGRQVGARRGASPLQELTFPRRARGTRGNRFGTARNINATTAAEPDGAADVITGPAAPGTGGTETVTAGPTAPGTIGTAGVNTVPKPPGKPQRPGQPTSPQQ